MVRSKTRIYLKRKCSHNTSAITNRTGIVSAMTPKERFACFLAVVKNRMPNRRKPRTDNPMRISGRSILMRASSLIELYKSIVQF